MFPPSLDFIKSFSLFFLNFLIIFFLVFLGCIYAGIIAVPISPPNPFGNFNSSLNNISNIIQ